MFDRMSASWDLACSSWSVLRKHKQLAFFPIISGIGCLLVLISFALPMALLVPWQQFLNRQGGQIDVPPWAYVVAFLFYFCNYFVIVFCNAGLISCTFLYLNGHEASLRDGFQAACSRLPQILAWALVSATVGVLLKIIEQAHEKAGQIVSAILGTAWTIMTYFVVPVLVVEKAGPFEAVQRSMQILKKTWGESLIGQAGIGLFVLLLFLPVIAIGLLGGMLFAGPQWPLGAALLTLGFVGLLCCSVISSALHVIYIAALYQYAALDQVPHGFDGGVLARAFRSKKKY